MNSDMSDESKESSIDGSSDEETSKMDFAEHLTGEDDDGKSVLLEDQPRVEPTLQRRDDGSGIGRRLGGFLALVLGLVGCVLSLAFLAASLRSGFSANDLAQDAAEPISDAVGRLETRIDQTDDLVDREGVAEPEVAVLRARVDGMVDTSTSASRAFAAVDDHVVYRWLPIDGDELDTTLQAFANEVGAIQADVGTSGEVDAAAASQVADRLNTMQASVTAVGDMIDTMVDSHVRSIRLASLAGFFASLWSLWAQWTLTRRGWRGVRGQQR